MRARLYTRRRALAILTAPHCEGLLATQNRSSSAYVVIAGLATSSFIFQFMSRGPVHVVSTLVEGNLDAIHLIIIISIRMLCVFEKVAAECGAD